MFNDLFNAIETELAAVEDIATKAYLIRGVVSSINGSAIGVAIQFCRAMDRTTKTVDGFNALINDVSSGIPLPELGVRNNDPMATIRALMFIKERLLDMGNFQDELRKAVDTPGDTFDYIMSQDSNTVGVKAMIAALNIDSALVEQAAAESRESNRQYLLANRERIIEMLADYNYDYEANMDEQFAKLPPKLVGKIINALKKGFDRAVNNSLRAAMQYNRLNRLTEIPLFQSCLKSIKTVESQLPSDVQAMMIGL